MLFLAGTTHHPITQEPRFRPLYPAYFSWKTADSICQLCINKFPNSLGAKTVNPYLKRFVTVLEYGGRKAYVARETVPLSFPMPKR